MDDGDFEGTAVLEQLAAAGRLEAFSDAVDADDFEAAAALMRAAEVDTNTIAIVLRKMRDADPA